MNNLTYLWNKWCISLNFTIYSPWVFDNNYKLFWYRRWGHGNNKSAQIAIKRNPTVLIDFRFQLDHTSFGLEFCIAWFEFMCGWRMTQESGYSLK